MRTVRIVHTTAANEAAGMAMMVLLGIVAFVAVGIYTLAHRVVSEHDIDYDDLTLSWSEPGRARYDNDPFYGGHGATAASYARGTYDITVDIRNNSPYRLYSLDYEMTLHVCDEISQPAEECPIIGTEKGQMSPDLVSRGRGMQKASVSFGKAGDYIGYGRPTLRWTGAHGVAS